MTDGKRQRDNTANGYSTFVETGCSVGSCTFVKLKTCTTAMEKSWIGISKKEKQENPL